jgi:pyruvate-formate lyase-activating enzyme
MHKSPRRSVALARGCECRCGRCPARDAAFRLARWLMRNEYDGEDVVQEASLRAFRYFRTFTGGDGRRLSRGRAALRDALFVVEGL